MRFAADPVPTPTPTPFAAPAGSAVRLRADRRPTDRGSRQFPAAAWSPLVTPYHSPNSLIAGWTPPSACPNRRSSPTDARDPFPSSLVVLGGVGRGGEGPRGSSGAEVGVGAAISRLREFEGGTRGDQTGSGRFKRRQMKGAKEMRYEVIFQSLNGSTASGANTRWLDYCRETAQGPDGSWATTREQAERWASEQCWQLEARYPWDFRFRIEEWRD